MKRLLLALAILVLAVSGVAWAASKGKAKNDTGTVYAAIVHQVGNQQIADGDAKSKLFGQAAITYQVTVSTSNTPGAVLIKANKITLWTKGGTISGTGQGTQTVNPDGTGNVTGGTFKLTKGTGALKGHSFNGTFSGPFNGTFYTFAYKATFK